jgi:hypothetical protein
MPEIEFTTDERTEIDQLVETYGPAANPAFTGFVDQLREDAGSEIVADCETALREVAEVSVVIRSYLGRGGDASRCAGVLQALRDALGSWEVARGLRERYDDAAEAIFQGADTQVDHYVASMCGALVDDALAQLERQPAAV